MMKRRSFSDKFKATVALEALRGDRTAQEIAAKHKVHPTQVTTWKRQAINGLVAIIDWCTRKVLARRISNTLEAEFCVDALNEAIHKFGPPEIMNTDQGSQFTSFAWTD